MGIKKKSLIGNATSKTKAAGDGGGKESAKPVPPKAKKLAVAKVATAKLSTAKLTAIRKLT
jgi:hypothetical protein